MTLEEYWGEHNNRYTIPENFLKVYVNNIPFRFIDVWGRCEFDEDTHLGIHYNEEKYILLRKKHTIN